MSCSKGRISTMRIFFYLMTIISSCMENNSYLLRNRGDWLRATQWATGAAADGTNHVSDARRNGDHNATNTDGACLVGTFRARCTRRGRHAAQCVLRSDAGALQPSQPGLRAQVQIRYRQDDRSENIERRI